MEPNSIAAKDGRIREGDRILQVRSWVPFQTNWNELIHTWLPLHHSQDERKCTSAVLWRESAGVWCVPLQHKEFICHNQLLLQLLHHHLQQRSLPLCLSLDSCLIIQNHMLGQTQQTRPALFSLRFWCRSCDTFGILWPLTSVHNEVWATNCIELHL